MRHSRSLSLLAGALATAAAAATAQQPGPSAPAAHDRTGVGDTSIFAPLLLQPSPNAYRAGSGAPGSRYWQNRADYDIAATLDTAAKKLSATMRIRYTNNSPDTLRFIWMQMEQNAFRDRSLNSYIFPQESRFGARGFEGGFVVERFDQQVGGAATTARGGAAKGGVARAGTAGGGATRAVKLALRPQETVMKVELAEPLAPGRTATMDVAWHFLVPEHGADRMGRDGALYELAQWYPRLAVYDDVRGWNTEPYLGQGEFYLEYGDFTYSVTVPAGYIVGGTGTLQNPEQVLTAAARQRLARAATTDSVVQHVVTEAELKDGSARPRSTGTLTWKFAARNVRDVAWGASPDYVWDATSWKGILAHAYYRPSAAVNWTDAADQARMSIEEYSDRWFPYPYPQITALEGPISGMEYPMVAMENRSDDRYDLFNVVTHEIGHMWYPMIVGSNERMYMWQDEGFNTFINTFAEGRRYPEKGDQMARAAVERHQIEQSQQAGRDTPVNIQPDRIDPRMLGLEAYVKPSVALQLLRQEILGPAAFDDAFRTYTRRWAFKHPTPADFFRTMEDVGGRRLDWFWREMFIENERFDQAVDTVVTRAVGDTTAVTVAYGNHARGVLPIRARFTFSDGSTEDYVYPAEVWSTNSVRYLREYRFMGKRPVKIELDPDSRLIDIDRANNVWSATGPIS